MEALKLIKYGETRVYVCIGWKYVNLLNPIHNYMHHLLQ
jgi:hypothetical protein